MGSDTSRLAQRHSFRQDVSSKAWDSENLSEENDRVLPKLADAR